ncbi:MAG TPA: methyltransferase domain-containing protein [Steroidobacteraceae bacterium]|nr:methyltransferase domain-containing protein [Steroidobacteraceae bacterium]
MSDRYTALRAFWQMPLGKSLLTAEAQLLGEALEDVFGWEFLQVGAWGEGRELLAGCRTRRKIVVAPGAFSSSADIIARPSALPVARDSVDAVLLPHTLEFASDPYAIVREVDRVLSGEGQLVVLGFQPLSLWGIRARSSPAGFPPGMRRILSVGRVREWLVLLGYEIVATRSYLHCTPWGKGAAEATDSADHSPLLRRTWFNPLPAGAWILKARKRIRALTPIRPRLREKQPAVIGQLVKPTTRQQP